MRIRSESDFDELAVAAKALAAASAWTELGLWDELARRDEPTDLAELPGDLRALEISAAALAHLGLLDGNGRTWRLSQAAREMHARGELPTGRNLDWLGDLSRMRDVLREGGPVKGPDGTSKVTSGGVVPDDRERTRAFLDMLYRRSEASVESAAAWLASRVPAGAHVLDVGGGHGRYARAYADRGFRATLFDMPIVVELAKERHGDAVEYRAGDFHDDEFGGPYGAAFLSNVVHGESDDANADMARRLYGALEPGGVIIYKDMFIDEQGRDPGSAVFFGLTMLYYTAQGRSYTLRDVARWCRGAGFEAPEAVSVDTHNLVFARKPR